MEAWLKAKTLGFPRWGWALALGGAIILGLYLRKRAAESEAEGTAEGEEAAEEGTLGYYEGTNAAGGLASAGLIGPAAGQVIPVETPMLPEGIVDIMGQLTTLASELGGYITEHQNVLVENPTGGGAPTTPSGEVHETPIPPVPAASCPNATVQKLTKNSNEIDRLQNEINGLQAEINQLTNYIQAHPNAKQVSQWKQQRAQDQTNIQGKRAKVTALSAENTALRKIPGCNKVKV